MYPQLRQNNINRKGGHPFTEQLITNSTTRAHHACPARSPLPTGSTADHIQDGHSDLQVPPRYDSTVLTDEL